MTQFSTNRLIDATSPYLQQHADNPVHWQPWDDATLTQARETDTPILLSIGYSACHWCHVMAHESFEDPQIAEVMNQHFVNIKVDREQRPDLDKIFQHAHQLMTGRAGGWPLTVFLDPQTLHPYYAGTYFPPVPKHQLPAFPDVCRQLGMAFHEQREQIRTNTPELIQHLQRMNPESKGTQNLTEEAALATRQQLEQQYDDVHGGFGKAPKFPHPTSLEHLLNHCEQHEDGTAWDMLDNTLTRMAMGGIVDHLGGGFCRYSVDDFWMIPHFEKMLYDNGPLLSLYARAWTLSQRPLYRDTVEGIATWVMREMQSPQGGYYSSLDADSEGEEGKFYVWTPEQVQTLLGEHYEEFAETYGLGMKANFEGKWHLYRTSEHESASLQASRQTLFEHRSHRIHPGRDDKILTSWNALMIKGMTQAGRLCQQSQWIDSAESALTDVHQRLWIDGRLLATCKDDKAEYMAYLDDYAYLLDAILEHLQSRWNSQWLSWAIDIADALLEHFEDPQEGGFFFTAHDHETLPHRPKPMHDDALPAGNGVAVSTLLHLGYLLGEQRYLHSAERCLHLAWPGIMQQPYAHTALVNALEQWREPGKVWILRGTETELPTWQQAIPTTDSCYAIPADMNDLPPALASKTAKETTVAYQCQGPSCQPPITDIKQIPS